MSPANSAPISVRVDPANPGQFFACCGLLELADRLWPGAEAWFHDGSFLIDAADDTGNLGLSGLIRAIASSQLIQLDPENGTSSPIQISAPFDLRLDWWEDERADGKQLKVWAGTMNSFRIARAMQSVLHEEPLQVGSLLDYATVVYDPEEPDHKVEPFYFDARRGASALPLDQGFSTDALQMTNLAYPAVEFLCLIGLQRFRPTPTAERRIFAYSTWTEPLMITIAPVAAAGLLNTVATCRFVFENAFRTDQRKHKAFTNAIARDNDE
jgi:hypothetical protein